MRSPFVSLRELAESAGTTTTSVAKMLSEIGLMSNGKPALRALILGIAKKFPYAERRGQVGHSYRWAIDCLALHLRSEDR